jgi:SAM-dependent methyltransferase
MTVSTPFDASDYAGTTLSRSSAEVIVDVIASMLQIRSVLDMGCGTGAWLAAFLARGVTDVVGIDYGRPARDQLQIPQEHIRDFDLERPVDLGRRFDLVVSLEVGEHLPSECSETYVDSLVRHSHAILFSAAIPGQMGAHHLNEQWPSYWYDRFAMRGYSCFDPFRLSLWNDDRIAWWYRQNLLLFADAETARTVAHALREGPPLALVHPILLETLTALAQPQGIRYHSRGLASAFTRRLSR